MGQELSVVRIPENYRCYKKNAIKCKYCDNELTWSDKYYRFDTSDLSSKFKSLYKFLVDVPFCTFNCGCKYIITKRKDKEIFSDIPSELFMEYGDSMVHYRFSQSFRSALVTYSINKINDNFDTYLVATERQETYGDGQIELPVVGYIEKRTKRSSWLTTESVICLFCKHKNSLNKQIYWSYTKKHPFCNLVCAYNYINNCNLLKDHIHKSNSDSNESIKLLVLYYGSIKAMIVNDAVFKSMIMDLDYVFGITKLCKDAIKTIPIKDNQLIKEIDFHIIQIGYQYY